MSKKISNFIPKKTVLTVTKDNKGRFGKGNPGKPQGAVHTLTRTFKEALTAAFNELQNDPKANLVEWGKKNPTAFYMVASKLIPTEVNHAVNEKVITVVVPGESKIEDAQIVP